ncbi:transglycosylase domain-containing protein [Sporolactobacillus pectinivorans]|uniref:transglycosylase domain-containing protein n=1 Tax=Sporolactobacillus pectinivorans TaxID=1591408 RepID=UPI001EFD88CB|nr:PBP1A family penicillin-binding protein [Sporolactobacillus pectinivorans]
MNWNWLKAWKSGVEHMDRKTIAMYSFKVAYFVLGAMIVGLLFYFVLLLVGNHYTNDKKMVMGQSSVVVDEQGHEISKIYSENQEPVSLKQVPKKVQDAFIATEDARFYQNSGIDLRGTFRAVVTDILSGSKAEGGSTITQQLARNAYLSNQKTWFRKAQEAAIAISLERKYTKDQILEMYLNQLYFGNGIYGIQMASRFFFNKDVSQLTEDQGALLAALPKGPNGYSPIFYPQKALERRNLVLGQLQKYGYISANEAAQLKRQSLGLNVHKIQTHPEYDTYIDMVKDEAEQRYHISPDDLTRGGYKIVVPMNIAAQTASYNAFQNNAYFRGTNPKLSPQGAFTLMNKDGGVMAVQGGRDYVSGSYNHVNDPRQPGSSFKPLAVYGPALDSGGYQPYSLLQDKEVSYGNYKPTNYNGVYRGKITMYDAITVSENAPAVWLLNQIGINKSKSYLSKMGINIPDKGLAIALGGLQQGVTPMQMASAYTAFDNQGVQSQPYFIQAIYNSQGQKIATAHPTTKKIFSPQTAWYMTRMLQSVVQNGTAEVGYSPVSIAGKTGSTAYTKNGLRDAWFVGYTPDAVGSVWIGYDTTDKNQYLSGSSDDAVRLFKSVVNSIPGQSKLAFEKPAGVSDLDQPVRLARVTNLNVQGTLGKFAMPALNLSWSGSSDKRIVYKIYSEENGKTTYKGEVTGQNQYRIDFVNPLSNVAYYVIPYNPQTGMQGPASDKVEVRWFSHL